MIRYLKRSLATGHTVLAAPNPSDKDCFQTEHLHILHNQTASGWTDPHPHLHTSSDEFYIVIEGSLTLDIEGERVSVAAGEICSVAAGTIHQVVEVGVPHQGFVVRAPSLPDKVLGS